MATGNDRKRRQDRSTSTKAQEERDIRNKADATGQERGAMPGNQPDEENSGSLEEGAERRQPDAAHTRDPKAFPSEQDRSGPGRKF